MCLAFVVFSQASIHRAWSSESARSRAVEEVLLLRSLRNAVLAVAGVPGRILVQSDEGNIAISLRVANVPKTRASAYVPFESCARRGLWDRV